MSSAGRPPPPNVPGYPKRNREPDLTAELAAKELERERAQARPAVPPPPEPHVETSAPIVPPAPPPPTPEKPPSVFERAKSSSWTPNAVFGGIVLVIGALGGNAGLSAILGASQTQKQEILAKIEENDRIEREERKAIRKDLTTTQEQVAYVAGLQCKQNGGKPHETFPCDGFPEATKANKDTKSPPWFVTEKPYPTALTKSP